MDVITKTLQKNIIDCIVGEREKQDIKWGVQNHESLKWLAILAEEFGEASLIVNELHPTIGECRGNIKLDYMRKLRHELKQTAAVCIAWLECIDRSGLGV